jgi:hypothetical protein
MGSNSSSGGGGGDNNRTKFGYTKPKTTLQKVGDFVKGGGVVGAIVRGVKKSKANKMDYEGQAAGVTPMRSPTKTVSVGNGGDGGGATPSSGQVVQAPEVTAPTTAEVSQSKATEAEDPILLRKRKAKAKGRSPTIMTGVTGATGSLTLGKPSLLGR